MPLINQQNDHLSSRLKAIADLVPDCERVLDIGTDHAFLPIELLLCGRCKKGVAIDIRPGPLAIASRHIRTAGLSDRIAACQNDGLQNIMLTADDVVVMAGLGGYEMMRILGEQPCQCRSIILQPMKSLPELRIWLCQHGYSIDQEKLVIEEKHSYVILRCHYSGDRKGIDNLTAWIGPELLRSKPDDLSLYLSRLLCRLSKQSRGEPELIPLISQIEELAAGIAIGRQPNSKTIPGGSTSHE